MAGLSPEQEEYFRTLEMLDPEGTLKDAIAGAKADLQREGTVVRGLIRIKGFTPND